PSTDAVEHPIDMGNIAGFLHAALRTELAEAAPKDRAAILERFAEIKTRADAQAYLSDVKEEMAAARRAATRGGVSKTKKKTRRSRRAAGKKSRTKRRKRRSVSSRRKG